MTVTDPRQPQRPQRLSQARGNAQEVNAAYWEAKTRHAAPSRSIPPQEPPPKFLSTGAADWEWFFVATLNFMAVRDAARRAEDVTESWKEWLKAYVLAGSRVQDHKKVLVAKTIATARRPVLYSNNVRRVAGEALWNQCRTVKPYYRAEWPRTLLDPDHEHKTALLDEFGIMTRQRSLAWNLQWACDNLCPADPSLTAQQRYAQLYAVLTPGAALTGWRTCEQVRIHTAKEAKLAREQWIQACEKALRGEEWDGLKKDFAEFTVCARRMEFDEQRARAVLSADLIARAQTIREAASVTRWVWHDPGSHNHRGDDGELDEQDGE